MLALRRCPRNVSSHFSRSFSWSRPASESLPAPDQFRDAFPYVSVARRGRVFIRNPRSAQLVANSFFTQPPEDASGGKVVIEAFPGAHIAPSSYTILVYMVYAWEGPGVLSRALLEQPSSVVKKLIILEDDELYLKYLMVSSKSRVQGVPAQPPSPFKMRIPALRLFQCRVTYGIHTHKSKRKAC